MKLNKNQYPQIFKTVQYKLRQPGPLVFSRNSPCFRLQPSDWSKALLWFVLDRLVIGFNSESRVVRKAAQNRFWCKKTSKIWLILPEPYAYSKTLMSRCNLTWLNLIHRPANYQKSEMYWPVDVIQRAWLELFKKNQILLLLCAPSNYCERDRLKNSQIFKTGARGGSVP